MNYGFLRTPSYQLSLEIPIFMNIRVSQETQYQTKFQRYEPDKYLQVKILIW